jgi:hypothetical protein
MTKLIEKCVQFIYTSTKGWLLNLTIYLKQWFDVCQIDVPTWSSATMYRLEWSHTLRTDVSSRKMISKSVHLVTGLSPVLQECPCRRDVFLAFGSTLPFPMEVNGANDLSNDSNGLWSNLATSPEPFCPSFLKVTSSAGCACPLNSWSINAPCSCLSYPQPQSISYFRTSCQPTSLNTHSNLRAPLGK